MSGVLFIIAVQSLHTNHKLEINIYKSPVCLFILSKGLIECLAMI